MNKIIIKRFIACVAFLLLTVSLIHCFNEFLVVKTSNRYYMMERELEARNEEYDIQIFGSCHAYTSFNSMMSEEEYGISSYNMAAASEVIPNTYLRMQAQFRKNAPKVALVETWGVNLYETYITTKSLKNKFLPPNISQMPFSLSKLEVIRDFDCLDMLAENFPIAKYKDCFFDGSLSEADINYFLETVAENVSKNMAYIGQGMAGRFAKNGTLLYAPEAVPDYYSQQGSANGESLAVEDDLMKYVEKIIELCDEYHVKLIFYRAPYRSTDNELKKANYLKDYFAEKGIPYFDLEEEIDFDTTNDFHDYEHLSKHGCNKATEFLMDYIMTLGLSFSRLDA